MRNYRHIMAFVFATIFAMTAFSPLSNAAFTHQDLTITLVMNGSDVSTHTTSNNALTIDLDEDLEGKFSFANNGETVHLSDLSVEMYNVRRILLWDWESKFYERQFDIDGNDRDGDGKEGFDIVAGFSTSASFTLFLSNLEENKEALRGQKVRVDVTLNFENIPDYTATVYVEFG